MAEEKKNPWNSYKTRLLKGIRFGQLELLETSHGKARIWQEMDRVDYGLCEYSIDVNPS